MLPRELGNHDVIHRLGEGGMGSVFLVRDRGSGAVRVAKVLHPRWRGDRRLAARFRREASILRDLRHPHLARLHEVRTYADEAVLLMEYVDGVPLDMLRRAEGRLAQGLVLLLGRQLAEALAHLHDHGVVHRDVAPDNVVVSWSDGPRAVLIDLGIAKSLATSDERSTATLTATGGFVGKLRYCAPEQLSPDAPADPRSDLYSLGIVLYECLSGRRAIEGDRPEAIVAGQVLRPIVPLAESDADREVSRLVQDLLAKEPGDRPQSALEVAGRLASLQENRPPEPGALEVLQARIADRGAERPDPDMTLTMAPPAARDRRRGARVPLVGFFIGAAALVLGALGWWAGDLVDPTLPSPEEVSGPAMEEHPSTPEASASSPSERAPSPERSAVPPSATDGDPSARENLLEERTGGPPVRPSLRRSTDAEPEARPPSPSVARLVVDATPWAEVLAIRDVGGAFVALPEDPSTPLAVEVPAGRYRVSLRLPDGRERTDDLVIPSGATVRHRPHAVDARGIDLLHDLGW